MTFLFFIPTNELGVIRASENLSINAKGDINVGVIGNMTISTGNKLGLFARTEKLGVIAGEGPLSVQAQNNRLDIFSEQKQTITSGADINFTGKKRIVLNGGGSYLKLENGKIEYGTLGDYVRKVPQMATSGANTLPMKMAQFPALSTPICIPCLLNAIKGNDAIVQDGKL